MRNIIVRFKTEKDFNDWILKNKDKLYGVNKNTNKYDLTKHKAYNKGAMSSKTQIKKNAYEERSEHWLEMPQYISNNVKYYSEIEFIFDNDEIFCDIIEQQITENTTSINIPKLDRHREFTYKRYIGKKLKNKYPIYIVSKSRPNDCTTSFYLSLMEVEHYIVVEPQQVKMYENSTLLNFKYATILEMDMSYQDKYDTFDDLGNTKSKGPGAARNFSWEHSISNGFAWHWVMDDNAIGGFYRFNNNERVRTRNGNFFLALENFVDRFDNIGQAGLNYRMFVAQNSQYPAYALNTRIYSFLLIRNDIPYRWRGRYNEDTDLSLRMLKDGWCTVQFNNFLADKARTQVVKGGNTEEFYANEGTAPKSQMLYDMHPDVTTLVYRFGRDHHYVDYTGFKQQLRYKDGLSKESFKEDDEYGLVQVLTNESVGNKNSEKTLSELNEIYLKDEFIIKQSEKEESVKICNFLEFV